MIKKILIANRGEIAVRVIRSCREMGISTVAVYSEVDRTSQHVFYADEAVCIGGNSAHESYLNMEKIFSVAHSTHADAIHPGYGFLSENATFARRCIQEGFIFIGPKADSIDIMGDKISSRKKMIEACVPVVPGTSEPLSSEDLLTTCDKIGFPVIIKATAGGGGKGMRLVREREELIEAYQSAKSEAESSFGNGIVYVEKYIESPHHIEFQILGDCHGNILHLFDRECSIQRRHQKIIEESPSPFISDSTRQKMGEVAILAAKAVDYIGAGTVEFMVDENQNFYFLEMNTRLQVEHPITEEVLGIDLVKEQIHIANGEQLRFAQSDIQQRGHAIECRICAEDTENGFMPSVGIVKYIHTPQGIGVRMDSYIYEGYEIPMYYDPMIGKLIVWATNRQYAIERMRRALAEYKISGIKTNVSYLYHLLDIEDFKIGNYTTHFLEKNSEKISAPKNLQLVDSTQKTEEELIAIVAAYVDYLMGFEENVPKTLQDNRPISRWREFGKQKGLLRI